MPQPDRPTVLLECVHTAARPQVAAAFLRHWQLDDPAGQRLDAVRRIRDEIRRHGHDLVASLTAEPGPRPGRAG